MLQSKHQAYKDLLEELNNMGISYLNNDIPQQQLLLYNLFLLDIPNINKIIESLNIMSGNIDKSLNEEYIKQWNKENNYYYKNISQVQRIRLQISQGVTSDITKTEITKSSGYIEYLLTLQIQQRQIINSFINNLDSLLLLFNEIKYLTDNESDVFYSNEILIENIRLIKILQEGFTEGINLIKNVKKTSIIIILLDESENINNIILNYSLQIKQQTYLYPSEPYPKYINKKTFDNISLTVEIIKNMINELNSTVYTSYIESYKQSLLVISNSIINSFNELNIVIEKDSNYNQNYNKSYLEFIKQTLVLFQNYDKCNVFNENIKFIDIHQSYINMLESFSLLKIIENVKDIINNYVRKTNKNIKYIYYLIYSIIYLLHNLLKKFINYSKSTSKLHYILCRIIREVFEKGFCKPQEEQEEQGIMILY